MLVSGQPYDENKAFKLTAASTASTTQELSKPGPITRYDTRPCITNFHVLLLRRPS